MLLCKVRIRVWSDVATFRRLRLRLDGARRGKIHHGHEAISVRKNGQTTNNSPARNFVAPPWQILKLCYNEIKVKESQSQRAGFADFDYG